MKSRKYILKMAYGGGDPKEKKSKPLPVLTPEQLTEFSNFSGSTNVPDINKALDRYNLKGVDRLYQAYDDDVAKGGNNITGARQDWIGSTTSRALANARRLGIAPEAFSANAKTIFGNDRYADTILNNKDFSRMYPNYMEVASNIYRDRYNNYIPSTEGTATTKAYGGTIDDLDENEFANIQEIATQEGITPEEALQMYENSEDEDSEDDETMAYGGIHIKKKNRGKFNALKKRTGKTTEELTHSKNALTRKRAIFAQNASRWNHAYGGKTDSNVEVEGKEAVQTPDGRVGVVKGPSHEQGGVDMNLPNGSRVYSDRLQIDGKSMKDRKLDREKRLKRVEKILSSKYPNQLSKNTVDRTSRNVHREEAQDMMLQKVANHIYRPPQRDNSTRESKRYAYGDIVKDVLPIEGMNPDMVSSLGYIDPVAGVPPYTGPTVSSIPTETDYRGMTAGDYVGMTGTLLGSILPLINTKNNARATPPNINRFRGYGHNALDDNTAAQDYLATSEGNELTDIDTGANSAYSRNNNSASSINTSRALNTITTMNADKARANVRSNYAKNMVGVLGQRSQLDNIADYRQMAGDAQVDAENKMDVDNYFSNLEANYSNLATGVQEIGRDLNIHQTGNDDADLLGLLTKNGIRIGRGSNGRYKLMNN